MRQRLLFLPTLMLSAALLLSSCGGNGNTPDTDGTGTFQVSALGPGTALKSGELASIEVTITPANGFSGSATVELVNPPPGVSATPVTVSVSGTTTALLTVNTGTAAGILELPVKVTSGTMAGSDNAYAFVYRITRLTTPYTPCSFPTCRFDGMKGKINSGYLWILGDSYSTANDFVQKVSLGDGNSEIYKIDVRERYNDYIASHIDLEITDNNLWIARNASYMYPPDILKFDLSGRFISRQEIDSEKDAYLLNLIKLSNSELAFTYKGKFNDISRSYIGLYATESSSYRLFPTPIAGYSEMYSLTKDPGGDLWSSSGTSNPPSVLRFSPSSGEYTVFPIGTSGENFATSVAMDDQQRAWYYDFSKDQLAVLDTKSGSIQRYTTNIREGHLFSAGGKIFLVGSILDGSMLRDRIFLIGEDNGDLILAEFPSLIGENGDIDAFAVDDSGNIGYESSGEAYTLPAN